MKDTNEIEENKKANPHTNSVSIIEINGNYGNSECGIDKEDILDVMGCKTRREIINLLREEPMFVSEISNELNIGRKSNHRTLAGYGKRWNIKFFL